MKAGIWARVSTDRQETENQVRQLRAWGERRGFEIAEECVYVVTESAWRGKQREDIKRVIADGRAGRIDVLMIWALDRLSREGGIATAALIQRIERQGVQVHSMQEEFTNATEPHFRDLMLMIFGWIAEEESRRRSERTKAGMARARAEGKRVGRPPRSRLVEQHPRYARAAELVASGEMSLAAGAKWLKVRYADFAEAIRKGQAESARRDELEETA